MKWRQGTYTQRCNRRQQVFGHLFQGRYQAVIVDGRREANYFPIVSTYIHLNPARAGLIRIGQERLKRYRWSSSTRVSQAVGKVKREPDRRQKRWQKELAGVGAGVEHPKD